MLRFKGDLEEKKKLLETARRAEKVREELKEAKLKALAEKNANDAFMSDAGAIALVELTLSYTTARLVNTSDTVNSVWEHIHKDILVKVEAGELPSTDARSCTALRHRYAPPPSTMRPMPLVCACTA